VLTTLADEPSLKEEVMALLISGWPRFMWEAHPSRPGVDMPSVIEQFPEWQFASVVNGRVIAAGHAIPLPWTLETQLPDSGWDQAIIDGSLGLLNGLKPTAVSGLAVTVARDHRGRGLSRVLLEAMKRAAVKADACRIVFPVRPNHKQFHPNVPMDEYVTWKRDDGLFIDPWMRTHQRMGAWVDSVCHHSVDLDGSRREWEGWCKACVTPDRVLPTLLCPLDSDLHYSEPNVWMEHPLPSE